MGFYKAPTTKVFKTPMKYKEGETLYLNSQDISRAKHGTSIPFTMLGTKVKIVDHSYGRFGGDPLLTIRSEEEHGTILKYIHQNDLGTKNSFSHPLVPFPKWMTDVRDMKICSTRYHRAKYVFYTHENEEKETYDYLMNNTATAELDDPCESCAAEHCDNCQELPEAWFDKTHKVRGLKNSVSDCWGDARDMYKATHGEWGDHPTRMGILLPCNDLYEHWLADYGLTTEASSDGNLRPHEVRSFYEYMISCRALPRYINLPDGKSAVDHIIKLRLKNLSVNRMYFYFVTARAPVQFPGVVRYTNHLIEKYGFEPLNAYIMAHIIPNHIESGHAVIDPGFHRMYAGHHPLDKKSIPAGMAVPDMDKVLNTLLRTHKFLNQKTEKTIIEEWDAGEGMRHWSLNNLLQNASRYNTNINLKKDIQFNIRYRKPANLSGSNFQRFSVSERRIKEAA